MLEVIKLSHVEPGPRSIGRVPASRSSEDQITLYKSVGIAAQDVVAASLVLRPLEGETLGSKSTSPHRAPASRAKKVDASHTRGTREKSKTALSPVRSVGVVRAAVVAKGRPPN